jgi:CheY-like chemotaxis protein
LQRVSVRETTIDPARKDWENPIVPDLAVILLVEDREDDVVLIRRSFYQGGITNPLQVVRNGEEAIAYLAGEGRYCNRTEYPLPGLILLDLKMPRVDGFEVLRWIRRQPGFSSIRVVVLTSSDAIRDVNRAYALGANSFLVKPLEFENVIETAKMLKTYWLRMDKAPEASRAPGELTREDEHRSS